MLNAKAAENKWKEEGLVNASQGRLQPGMLDVQPSGDMTQSERALWNELVQDLVAEMETPSTHLGNLVRKIQGSHSDDRSGEAELVKEFSEFCNHVAGRLVGAGEGQSAQGVSGTFRISGEYLKKDGHVLHPDDDRAACDDTLDIIISGETTEEDADRTWDYALTFGEVRSSISWDLDDTLFGRMLRYLRDILEDRPISGKNVCFSLCGHLLRLYESDPVNYGTSSAYSFRDPEDYEKIICAIALLSGPPFLVSEQWEPSPEEILSVQKADGQCVEYHLKNVLRLAISPVIWGSRTAAWSAVATRVGKIDDLAQHEHLPLFIKSTWLSERLYSHELDILGHIDTARNRCIADESFVPLLPFAVGHAINTIPGSATSLDGWKTGNGRIQNTTMVTFCEKGRHVDQDRPTLRSHTRFHRSLTKTLGWLARTGIHYRDLNNGNVLRTSLGFCVLIDFGNARHLNRPRGHTGDQPVDLWDLLLDDAGSGTLMFVSRRIHALTIESNPYKRQEDSYNRQSLALERPNPLTEASELAKHEGSKARLLEHRQELQNIHHQHRYIDDAEAQLYLMMQQTLLVTKETAKFEIMEDLKEKQDYWEDPNPLEDTRLVRTEWSFFEDVALAFRRKVDATLEEIKVGLEAGTLEDSDGTAFDCENLCYDLLDEIWATEEARQDEEDRKKTVRASKKPLRASKKAGRAS